MTPVQLVTLDPGHFHAALVQKDMVPGVAPRVHVYAPLGPDLLAHLGRVAGFNARAANPTSWELEVHAGPDYLPRLLREKPGQVVVLAGRNRAKIDYILAAVDAGLNVLADKPWVIDPADLPKLRQALDRADAKGLVAYDIMTERHEITSFLQKELIHDPETFGSLVPGTAEEPGVYLESKHYLMKQVAGVPLRRPPWFFDTRLQGEGLSDVGTHLVDLVPWMLFPGQPINESTDIHILAGKRWPTVLTPADFQRVTGEAAFPGYLAPDLHNDRLDYYCNTRVTYSVRGAHVTLNVLWDYEAAPGAGDTHFAVVRGTRARVEIRQGAEQKYRPELYVVPNQPGGRAALGAAVRHKVASLQGTYPGIAVAEAGADWQVTIPDAYRVGHEAHFGAVLRHFLEYLRHPGSLPSWEKPNMLAKYSVTTRGVEKARAS